MHEDMRRGATAGLVLAAIIVVAIAAGQWSLSGACARAEHRARRVVRVAALLEGSQAPFKLRLAATKARLRMADACAMDVAADDARHALVAKLARIGQGARQPGAIVDDSGEAAQ